MRTKLKLVDKKTIIVPFVVSILVFFVLGRVVVQGVNDHYLDHTKESAYNLAKGYANSIEKSFHSEAIINQLLTDKLLLAGKTTGIYAGVTTRESLLTVATQLNVDEINIYDMEGNIVLTTMPDLDAWQPPTDHPVQVFIRQNQETFVEEIRENAVTGLLYKYGYFRSSNQFVIQIGISAEFINDLSTEFTLSSLLTEMIEQKEIDYACFLNGEQVVIASTRNEHLGQSPQDEEVLDRLLLHRAFGSRNSLNHQVYDYYFPVYVQGIFVGTLTIGYSLIDQHDTVNSLIGIGLLILFLVFLMITYVIYANYHKNKKLSIAAYYDTLTGLPNEKYLQLTFKQLINEFPTPFSFILVNIHEFRHINMTYGYEVGDAVIKDVGERLSSMQRPHTSVFRLNSDRFILLETKNYAPHKLEIIAKQICLLFSRPFEYDHIRKQLHTRVGALMIDDKKMNLSKAIQNALITLDNTPKDAHCYFTMYNQEIVEKVKREDNILSELQEIIEGMDRNRLSIVLQPQYQVTSDSVVGFEALARLTSKTYGPVSPVEFIEIAEKHNIIYQLGKLILHQACGFVKELHMMNQIDVRVAINISVLQLNHAGFVDMVKRTIRDYQIDTKNIEIEITESVFMKDVEDSNSVLKELRNEGILISLDDFGTGFSSFYRLRDLEVDILKIDRSFISMITKVSKESLISEEIINMAHKLGLLVVAEGVELEEEYQYLIDHDCDIIQGYYYSRPLTCSDALAFAKEKNKT